MSFADVQTPQGYAAVCLQEWLVMVNNLQNLINLVSEDQISVFLQEKKNPLCAIFILFL